MNEFTIGGQLFAGPPFEAYDAWSKKYGGGLVVKVYKRSCMASAASLLQAAIRQAPQAQSRTGSMTLIDVVLHSLSPRGLDDELTVNFIFRKNEGIVPDEELRRDDDTGQVSRALDEYGPLELRVLGNGKELFVGRNVVVKSQKFLYVNNANNFLREAFVQASVAHERNCRLLDIYVAKEPQNKAFKLQLLLEKMDMDVSQNIEERTNREQPYTERELLEFLCDVSEGLLHAKKLVSSSKHIAHCDIKPANIFVTNGRYKLGDFGSAWTKAFSTQTLAMQSGTPAYMSPELRKANPSTDSVDLFAVDVYSLGMTLLHMATLSLPTSEAIQTLGYSKHFKKLLSGMIDDDFESRLQLSQVMAKCKAQLVPHSTPEGKKTEERKHPVTKREQLEEMKQLSLTTVGMARTPSGVPSSKSTAVEESKAPPVFRQARTQGTLFRLAYDSEGKMDGRWQVLDIDSRTWAPPQRPTLQMEVDYATCYAFATETAVVLCGSKLHLGDKPRTCHAAGTSAYRVEFAESPPTVTALPSFPERRVQAGLYVFEKVLFTFGG